MITSFFLCQGLLYILCIPVGHFFLHFSFKNRKLDLPFFVIFPLVLSLGLLILAFILFVVSLIIVNGYVIITVVLMLLSLDLSLFLFEKKKMNGIESLRLGTLSAKDLIPIGLFVVTFLNFSLIVGSIGWSPIGDAIEHGLQTSLLLANGRVQLDYQPLSLNPLDNPLGFHSLAADLASLTGMFPGQAVFVLATSILVLIPTLLCSLTYLASNSVILSSLAFLSAFIIAPPSMEYHLTGYFYNGPYPNLFGFLGAILFCSLELLKERVQKEISVNRHTFILLIVILGISVIYTNFALFPILYILFRYPRKMYYFMKNRWKIIVMLSFICISAILLNVGFIGEVLWIVMMKFQKILERSFNIGSPFFLSIPGGALIGSTLVSIFFFFRRIHTSLALFFIVIVVPCLASISPIVSHYLSIFLPRRSLVIVTLLSWPIILIFVAYLFSIVPAKHIRDRFSRLRVEVDLNSAKVAIVSVILVLPIIMPSLAHNFTFSTPPAGWFELTEGNDDYKVLQWISANVSLNDLILNDFSYPSQFLLSFSIKNVTCHYHPDASNYGRLLDSHSFWKHPDDYDLFLRLVQKYDIKYVLVTSVSGYHDWIGVGGNDEYVKKPFGVTTREVFDNNPSVQLVYGPGLAAVYEVKV